MRGGEHVRVVACDGDSVDGLSRDDAYDEDGEHDHNDCRETKFLLLPELSFHRLVLSSGQPAERRVRPV